MDALIQTCNARFLYKHLDYRENTYSHEQTCFAAMQHIAQWRGKAGDRPKAAGKRLPIEPPLFHGTG